MQTPNIKEVVANLYNKGDYFQNSKEWFYQKYLLQYRLRSIFIIVSCIVSLMTCLSFYLVMRELVRPQTLSGVIHNDLNQKYSVKISKIKNHSNKHSDKIIARILIEDFIYKIESFNSADKAKELELKNNIFNNGSLQLNMVEIFQNRFQTVYIPSYISGYKRLVEVKTFKYMDPDDNFYYKMKNYFTPSEIGNRAQVKFIVKYLAKNGELKFQEEYLASIKFFFRPIKKIDNEFTKIKFFIEEYNLTRLSQTKL